MLSHGLRPIDRAGRLARHRGVPAVATRQALPHGLWWPGFAFYAGRCQRQQELSDLQRGYYGIYHFMSAEHLHRYVKEFSFRHNIANLGTVPFIDMTIDQITGKRLTYERLINA